MFLCSMKMKVTNLARTALVHCVGQIILITAAATYMAIGFPFCVGLLFLLQKFYKSARLYPPILPLSKNFELS